VVVAQRHHKRKLEPVPVSPEQQQRDEQEREGWKKRAEEECTEGVRQNDGAGRWLAAKDQGRRSLLLGAGAGWRSRPVTPEQERAMRRRGLNPLLYRTRGAASDALNSKKGRP
jgi:hypothetical protein